MAAPTIGRRPRLPPLMGQVDWSHPLAAGLKMYVMPGVSRRDLVEQTDLTVSAGTVGPSRSSYGVAGLAVSARWAIPHISRFSVLNGGQFTVFGCGHGFTEYFCARESNPLKILIADDIVLFRTRQTTLNDLTKSGTSNGSVDRCCTGTFNNGAKTLYVDNLTPVTSSADAGINNTTADTSAVLYGDGFNVTGGNDTIAVVAYWDRALSANEVAQLHADPYCILRY